MSEKRSKIIICKIRGKVKLFKRGYGFINFLEEDNINIKNDIFVHYSKIISDEKFKTLEEGDIVEFDLVEYIDGRLRALNVRKIDRIGD